MNQSLEAMNDLNVAEIIKSDNLFNSSFAVTKNALVFVRTDVNRWYRQIISYHNPYNSLSSRLFGHQLIEFHAVRS